MPPAAASPRARSGAGAGGKGQGEGRGGPPPRTLRATLRALASPVAGAAGFATAEEPPWRAGMISTILQGPGSGAKTE